jgi:hypothetical protein
VATELIQSLGNEGARHQVETLLRTALREPAFGELDALLRAWIDEHPGPLTALCRDVGPVSVTGWDTLDADIAALAAKGTLCSAVGIDVTGHYEGEGPQFEVSLYSDKPFPFSTSGRSAVLAACETYGTVWQGAFEDLVHSLNCSGLEALHGGVANHPQRHWVGGVEMPEDFPDYFIGVWFLYLRVNEALAAAVEEGRLPYPMPMLVSEHDFGPWFETVHMVDQGVAVPVEQGIVSAESRADRSEPAAPAMVTAEITAFEIEPPEMETPEAATAEIMMPDVTTAETGEPEVQAATVMMTAQPSPSRGWPWRRSPSKPVDSVGEALMNQRRRGPDSFASN